MVPGTTIEKKIKKTQVVPGTKYGVFRYLTFDPPKTPNNGPKSIPKVDHYSHLIPAFRTGTSSPQEIKEKKHFFSDELIQIQNPLFLDR